MSTVSGNSIRGIHNRIVKNPGWLPILVQYVKQIEEGFYPQEWIDAIFQSSIDYPDIYSAYCFAHINAWVGTGKVLTAIIEVETAPFSDKEIEMNNAILEILPYPFKAKFIGIGSSQDRNDGYLEWITPIEFGQILYNGKEIVEEVSPRAVPLEVGTTQADRTFHHILHGGVARWPYESERIYLLIRNPQMSIKVDGLLP